MTNLFRLMGKTTAETAQNLIGGITEFAKINDLAPQAIFAQIKDAGEDIYKFSSGTAENFVKQAGLLTKMSVSMSQMMKASDSMVLNYKDSIKAEMSLSAMLGKNVNLSEVRARLMQNDQAGAASALKTALGGVDINAMNAFQKQALTQATGMDISALMGLQQGKGGGVTGVLTEQEKAGKAFADGALKQDISNAAAKLALEQKQRKELLQFEQKQRLIMLMIEQQQRLDSIQLEAAYRAEWEFKYAKKFEEDQAAAAAMVETATGVLASRGTKMTEQALTAMGISTSGVGGALSAATSKLQQLESGGFIKNADMSIYYTQLIDVLSAIKTGDMKNPDKIAAAVDNALNNSFGGQLQQLQSAKDTAVQKRVAAAQFAAQTKNQYDNFGMWRKGANIRQSYYKEQGLSAAEIKSIEAMITKTTFKQGNYTKETYGVSQSTIDELKKANDVGVQTKVAEAANKNVVAEVTANGEKTVAAQNKVAIQQMKELSEAEYNTKLQLEIIAMLGLSGQLLDAIAQNTKGDKQVILDGRTLRKNLLEQSRRNYGVSRKGAAVGGG
jgi:hypothetical protein